MQAMESITAKINAIFDNENDAWQEMTLEVGIGLEPLFNPTPDAEKQLTMPPPPAHILQLAPSQKSSM